ncbi:MAG: hypothetical protein K0M49_06835 [Arenimonas sp.]|nr:hypothetical protein [Arenimonas sp.]
MIGLWMIWRGISAARHGHGRRKGASFGFVAGLIPFPLTLFVMTYATARGVPALGLVFAAPMLAGVAATLSAVAIAANAFRVAFDKAFNEKENCLGRVSKVLAISAGLVMVGVALDSIA